MLIRDFFNVQEKKLNVKPLLLRRHNQLYFNNQTVDLIIHPNLKSFLKG